MALNTSIAVTAYNFDSTGNKLVNTRLIGIPLPAEVILATSPDPSVYVYSKILYENPKGFIKSVYTAETVQQIITKMNA